MTPPAYVRVAITVDVDPATAFEIFTEEIDLWYKRGPHNFYNSARTIAIRFEPYVGGRLLEIYDEATGEGREHGRITVFEPGARLVFVDNRDTEVDVRFEPDGDGTRVTLEHRGLEKLAPRAAETKARFGGRLLIGWFSQYMQQRTAAQRDGDTT